MIKPKVSVVLNTYNRSSFLKEAIESVCKQTFQDWELIIVDDGSTDDTRQVASEYTNRDPRVCYVRHDNHGVVFSRNRGLELSNGRYIAFLDDDDVWLPEKLAEQTNMLESNPDVDLVYVWAWRLDTDTDIKTPEPQTAVEDHTYPRLFQGNYICSPSAVLLRRDCFDKVGLFDSRLDQTSDYDLWLRIVAYGLVIRPLQKRLLLYRRHSGSMMKEREKVIAALIKCVESAPLAFGVTKVDKNIRLSECYYLLANEYLGNKKRFEAARAYFLALKYCPAIGMRIEWNKTASPFYRFIRPWLAIVYCFFRGLGGTNRNNVSSEGTSNEAKQFYSSMGVAMDGPPLVSVIIPTCNRAELLNHALQSVFNQSFKNYEIIVVDDGSKNPFGVSILKDKQASVLRNSSSAGVASARNAGIKNAKGRLIAFLDDDDMWLPDHLETQVRVLEQNPDIGVVSARAQVVDENGNAIAKTIKPSSAPIWNSQDLLTGSSPLLSATVIRKSALLQIGLFDAALRGDEDIDLYMRLSTITEFHFNEKINVLYRRHGSNWTSGAVRPLEGHIRLCNKAMKIFRELKNNENVVAHLSRKHYVLGRQYFFLGRPFSAIKHILRSVFLQPKIGISFNSRGGVVRSLFYYFKPYAVLLLILALSPFSVLQGFFGSKVFHAYRV